MRLLRALFAGRGRPAAAPFDARHPALHRELRIPRAPEWSAAIEDGVAAFGDARYPEAAARFHAAEQASREPLHEFIAVNDAAAAWCAAARFADAEPLYRRLVERWSRVLPPEDRPEIILGLNNLATALRGQGRHAEAEAALRRALGMESCWGAYPDLADTLENLALLHLAGNGTSGGEATLWAAWSVAIREEALGADHPDVAAALGTLAGAHTAEGRADEAERVRARARRLREQAMEGIEVDETARPPACGLWDSRGRWIEPRSLAERAVAMRRRGASPDDVALARSLDSLAMLHRCTAPARWMDFEAGAVQAEPLLQDALRIRRRILGPEHLDVVENRERLAEVEQDFQAGREVVRNTWSGTLDDALAIKERICGREHPALVPTLTRLADSSRAFDWARSAGLLDRALAIAERAYDPDDPRLALPLERLADVRGKWEGRWEEAGRLYARALAIRERTVGADHPAVAAVLGALAEAHAKVGRLAEAAQCHRRRGALEERVFGAAHPRVTAGLEALAEILDEQRDADEAGAARERALALREERFEAEQPDVAERLRTIAEHYEAEGLPVPRRQFYRALWSAPRLVTSRHRVPEDDPFFPEFLEKLASSREAEGDDPAAEWLLTRALGIRERVTGDAERAALPLSRALAGLADFHQARGRLPEAARLLERALDVLTSAFGDRHVRVAQCLNRLAEVHWNGHRHGDAERLLRRSLAIAEANTREHPALVARTLNNLGLLCGAAGRHPEAEAFLARSLSATEQTLGRRHPETATTLVNLARACEGQGRLGDAEPLLGRALEIQEQAGGADDPALVPLLERRAAVLRGLGRAGEAESLETRARRITAEHHRRPA